MKAIDSVKEVVRYLQGKHPFLAGKLFTLEYQIDNSIPTAATDGKQILFNESFFNSLNFEEKQTLIAHEVAHIIFMHHYRLKGKDAKIWNAATDYAINILLKKMNFKPLKNWLYDEQFQGWTAENIYNHIQNNSSKEEKENLSQQSNQSSGQINEPENYSQDDIEIAKKELNQAVNTVKRIKKGIESSTSLSDSEKQKQINKFVPSIDYLSDSLKQINNPSIDWHSVLKRFIAQTSINDFSFQNPDLELFQQTGFFLPSLYSEEPDNIVLALDVSGSMAYIAKHVASEIFHALNNVNSHSLSVYYVSSLIHKHKIITNENEIELITGNSTNFKSFFDEFEKVANQYKALVFITDGIVDTSNWKNPNIPVLWLLPFDNYYFKNTAPFGEISVFNS